MDDNTLQVVIPEKYNPAAPKRSWFGVIFALISFIPAGIWMAIAKLHREKDRYLANGKGVAIIGWVIFGMGMVYCLLACDMLVEGYSEMESMLIFFGWIAMGGLLLVLYGRKYKKIGEKHLHYYPIIVNSLDGSLDNIAATVGKDYDTVCKDIQQLIDKGLFADGCIYHNERRFVCHALGLEIPSAFEGKEKPSAPKKAIIEKEVKCPNCGGITNVQGDGDYPCDYCGTMLRVR